LPTLYQWKETLHNIGSWFIPIFLLRRLAIKIFLESMFHNWELYYLCAVRVISKKTLRGFWLKHNGCEERLKAWHKETEEATWKTPQQIKVDYPSASFLADNRVVFNIKGNSYRLIVKINYDFGIVWIRFVGTHAEYDKINAITI
jgi:mRNA interferase HigB